MRMKRQTVATRLYLLIGLATAALLLVIAAAVVGSGRMVAAGERLHERGVQGLDEASRLAILFERQRGLVSRAPAETDLERQHDYRGMFEGLNARIDAARARLEVLVPSAARPQVQSLAAAFADMRRHAATVFDFSANFVQDKATDLLNGEFAAVEKRIDSDLQEILKGMRASSQSEVDELTGARTVLLLTIGSVSVVALGLVVGFGTMLARSLSRRLRRITAAMSAISSGDSEGVRIPSTQDRDEVGEMARTLEVFRQNGEEIARLRIKQVEGEQRAATERREGLLQLSNEIEAGVQAGVDVLLRAAQDMEQSAGKMSAAIEETGTRTVTVAAAAEAGTTSVSTIASAVEQLSASIGGIIEQLGDVAQDAGKAAGDATAATTTIESLDRAAEKIGEVVGLIQSVASQTNLLALNATIEAARAGEAGRGFAVVASEVKSLAAQTAKATESITAQVGEIQAATREAVVAIREIHRGIAAVDARTSDIATAMDRQKTATGEISRNTNQAAGGTRDVSENINVISEANRTASDMASAVSSSAAEVAGQAQRLRLDVAEFLQKVRAA
jgi:methyl-accepting chemotaxis protein